MRTLNTFLAVCGLVALGACESGTAPGTAHVRVLLTDAPSDLIERADVWVSHIYLQGGGEENDTLATSSEADTVGRVDLFNDPGNPKSYDLMTLRDGVTADLTGTVEVDVAMYHNLRLVVDSAMVTLKDGITMEDGSSTTTLFVPSGQTSGIKVQLAGPIDAEDGEEIEILVDFDVDQNFVIQGIHGPGGIRDILFTPRLQEVHRTKQ
ncbi:MAG: DUF4382 domain-containing protein [Gemmatimonadota bacterium]|nr:DUF4382 domain-containing protein [Gemmatimonadota bacterium]